MSRHDEKARTDAEPPSGNPRHADLTGDRRSVEQEPIPAAVVSESLAKRLWPAERYATPWAARSVKATTGPPVTVIGMVQDVRPAALDRELLQIYRPHPQRPSANMTLVVRTSQESGALAKVVRTEIGKMDPEMPTPAIRTMREIVSTFVPAPFPTGTHFPVCPGCAAAWRGWRLRGGQLFRSLPNAGYRTADRFGRYPGRCNALGPVLSGLAIGLGGAATIA